MAAVCGCSKGLVQYHFPLGDGSGLKLTVAKYLTPQHHDIATQGGLAPDIACNDYPHGARTMQRRRVMQPLRAAARPPGSCCLLCWMHSLHICPAACCVCWLRPQACSRQALPTAV